jgi:hypothetical protein
MTRKMPPKPENLRKVLSMVADGNLVHLHLACGHLITQLKSDFDGRAPTEIDCWACAAESNST